MYSYSFAMFLIHVIYIYHRKQSTRVRYVKFTDTLVRYTINTFQHSKTYHGIFLMSFVTDYYVFSRTFRDKLYTLGGSSKFHLNCIYMYIYCKLSIQCVCVSIHLQKDNELYSMRLVPLVQDRTINLTGYPVDSLLV